MSFESAMRLILELAAEHPIFSRDLSAFQMSDSKKQTRILCLRENRVINSPNSVTEMYKFFVMT